MSDDFAASRENLLAKICSIIAKAMPQPGVKQTFVKTLAFARRDDPSYCHSSFTKPMCALICQGAKMIQIGGVERTTRAGQIFLTSVDTPHCANILEASPSVPFYSLHFLLDRKLFAELMGEMPYQAASSAEISSVEPIYAASPAFLETIRRMAEIADFQQDAEILGPLLLKELHYLLLTGPQGNFLYHLYMRGTTDNRIVEAIMYLKRNINRAVSMDELARKVFMSVSSLHRHFKKVTGYSPLQYHKELRLYEAQRLMLAENERADMAALAVGYESVTQFNREYKRKFGLPPHQDITARRKRVQEGLEEL